MQSRTLLRIFRQHFFAFFSPDSTKGISFALLVLFLSACSAAPSCPNTCGKHAVKITNPDLPDDEKHHRLSPAESCEEYQAYVGDRSVQDLVEQISTVKEAVAFVNSICYKEDDDLYGKNHWAALQQTHNNGGYGDCDDAAIAGLAVLADDLDRLDVLNKLQVLVVWDDRGLYHAVALYGTPGKYGSIGRLQSHQNAQYSLSALANRLFYYDEEGDERKKFHYEHYKVFDLTSYPRLLSRGHDGVNLKRLAKRVEQ